MKQLTHGGIWSGKKQEKYPKLKPISIYYLMSERYFEPSAMDSYFEKQDNKIDIYPLKSVF